MAFPHFAVVALSLSFGPSSDGVGFKREISPGKTRGLLRTTAGSTPPEPWSSELRGSRPARPARQCLLSDSCSSAHGFASPFFQSSPRGRDLGVHLDRYDLLSGGLSPPSHMPCWAHREDGHLRTMGSSPMPGPRRPPPNDGGGRLSNCGGEHEVAVPTSPRKLMDHQAAQVPDQP